MSNGTRRARDPQMPGQRQVAKPTLTPSDPLPGWKAVLQAAILLGVPLTLLLVARLILRKFFPSLGY